MKNNKLKILIGCHKPTFLPEGEEFVPMHLGRVLATEASKDGKMSQEDYRWMLDNMIGDDTGENISELNRRFCELTALYWAWKNYSELDSPEYIGFMHYRRLFRAEDYTDYDSFDVIVPSDKCQNTVKKQYEDFHYLESMDDLLCIIKNKFPEYYDISNKYLEQNESYFFNMFIMKKDLFFEYCNFLFEILLDYHKSTNYDLLSAGNQRLPGFLAERLSGIFFYKLKKDGYKIKPCKDLIYEDIPAKIPVKKVFDDAITICLSSDDNYAQYLAVLITSIKNNALDSLNYDVCVIDEQISPLTKQRILKLQSSNFSIRFINISAFLKDIDKDVFHLNQHFTISTYYRFFIPEIFKEYSKVLYLDCDMVVHSDISELFATNLDGYHLGAVLDIEMSRCLFLDRWFGGSRLTYVANILKMEKPEQYFQAGVLLLDIKKLSEMDFTNICIERLKEIKSPMYVDQCILNSIFDGNIKFLNIDWNVQWQIPLYISDLNFQLPVALYNSYIESRKKPKIIHYSGGRKPWSEPEHELAEIWWKYARMTPFYEEILFKNLKSQTIIQQVALQKYSLLHKVKSYCNRKFRHDSLFYKVLRSSYVFARSIWRKVKNRIPT